MKITATVDRASKIEVKCISAGMRFTHLQMFVLQRLNLEGIFDPRREWEEWRYEFDATKDGITQFWRFCAAAVEIGIAVEYC